MDSPFLLPFNSTAATLESVGGKGLALGRLARAGLPVPAGFHLTTAAYRAFVAAAGLDTEIRAALEQLDPLDPAALEAASARIRAAFERGDVPAEIAAALRQGYASLGEAPVAVRSSATAEDLPEASFAGQQDTFLNVRGVDDLLRAARRCWSSLWTARAIAYRAKNAIPAETAALAVVVQEMVAAESSGVLFTANPLNGSRQEMLVNAAWGLGEGIVSGLVSPDVYTIDKASGKTKKLARADKQVMSVYAPAGGTLEQSVPAARRKAPVLMPRQVEALAGLARRTEAEFGSPQDIEWCWAGARFFILQSRPVTSLPLCWDPPQANTYYARGSLVEYLPDPLTPLYATFGVPIANRLTIEMFQSFGIHLWKDAYYTTINGYLFGTAPGKLSDFLQYIGMATSLTPKMLKGAEELWRSAVDAYTESVERWSQPPIEALSARELLSAASDLYSAAMRYYTVFQTAGAPTAGSYEILFTQLYNRLIRRKGDPDGSLFVIGEENQAMRAEKELFDMAAWVRAEGGTELAACLEHVPARELAEAFHGSRIPEFTAVASAGFEAGWGILAARIGEYNRRHGHMLYEVDFGKSLPGEDVAPLFDALKAYLSGKSKDPRQRQQAVLERREALTRQVRARLDPLRRKWFDQALAKALHFAPIREDSIAVMGLSYPLLRRAFNELGRRMAAGGALEQAADIYWLEAVEVEDAVERLERGTPLPDLSRRIPPRKDTLREMQRGLPPVFLPRGSWIGRFIPWKENNEVVDGMLKGIGASAGRVTARARILLGPEDFERFKSGDVLVAPTTTPAWTALFTLASAVVTDIGGPLSHSSIVAREYGIPAVMATGNATRLIREGQWVTVDGAAGTVTLHKE